MQPQRELAAGQGMALGPCALRSALPPVVLTFAAALYAIPLGQT